MNRPRPRNPGKPNPALAGKKATVPPAQANARQMVPEQLAMGAKQAQLKARAGAARDSIRSTNWAATHSGDFSGCGGADVD